MVPMCEGEDRCACGESSQNIASSRVEDCVISSEIEIEVVTSWGGGRAGQNAGGKEEKHAPNPGHPAILQEAGQERGHPKAGTHWHHGRCSYSRHFAQTTSW